MDPSDPGVSSDRELIDAEAAILAEFQTSLSELFGDRSSRRPLPSDDPAILGLADRAVARFCDAAEVGGRNAPTAAQRGEIRRRLYLTHCSLGPLAEVLALEGLESLHISGTASGSLEFADRREALPLAFESDEELVRLATFYAELGGKDDLEDNLISTELPGGLQFDAILPPAALPPQITIQATRAQSAPTLAELAATGCIPCPAEAILMTAIKARLNLVVSGPTGIGASQLASALLGAIEPWERTSVIDPDQGLTLPQAGVGDFFRVGRWPSSELRDALIRQVTARIVLADVTRHGALHLLPPWTGIEGSIAVIRAGDARQALTRLGLSVSLGSPGLSQESVNEIVDGSVDLILHVDQRPRGASHSWRLALLAFVDLNRERPSRLPVLVRCGSLRPQGVQWEWSSAALASPPAKVVEKLRAAGVYPGALAAGALDGDG